MQLHISTGDGVPIYRQIVNQVKYLVASDRLHPGDEVPTIRSLAEELLINPNTVARAYRELEQAGVLKARQGSGTVVADAGSPLAAETKRRILSERIDALLTEARQLDVDFSEIKRLLEERNNTLHEHEEKVHE